MPIAAAMIHDVRAAIAPPAIERVEFGRGVSGKMLPLGQDIVERAVADAATWRAGLDDLVGTFDARREIIDDEATLVRLDRLVRDTAQKARAMRREVDRSRKRYERMRLRIEAREPGSTRDLRKQTLHLIGVGVANAEALQRLHESLSRFRDRVDTRGRDGFRPDPETVTAMQEARSGTDMRRVASMAELHAEGD